MKIEVKETLMPTRYPEDDYSILGEIKGDGRGILITSQVEDERWNIEAVEKELNRIEENGTKVWGDLHFYIGNQLILVLILPSIIEAQTIFREWKENRKKFLKEVMQCK